MLPFETQDLDRGLLQLHEEPVWNLAGFVDLVTQLLGDFGHVQLRLTGLAKSDELLACHTAAALELLRPQILQRHQVCHPRLLHEFHTSAQNLPVAGVQLAAGVHTLAAEMTVHSEAIPNRALQFYELLSWPALGAPQLAELPPRLVASHEVHAAPEEREDLLARHALRGRDGPAHGDRGPNHCAIVITEHGPAGSRYSAREARAWLEMQDLA
mmetsp:Transcript_13813/g.37456  ORF Transcript_13813/g.37456 Transcript_13813/m.37456 type:complete len:213 (+) Transcript_13813:598-1236(+)